MGALDLGRQQKSPGSPGNKKQKQLRRQLKCRGAYMHTLWGALLCECVQECICACSLCGPLMLPVDVTCFPFFCQIVKAFKSGNLIIAYIQIRIQCSNPSTVMTLLCNLRQVPSPL